jgi:restriction endonuclease S subunit
MKLQEISQLFVGYTFREGVQSVPGGQAFVVASRDLEKFIIDDTNDLQEVDAILFKRSKFLQSGDILLSTRGTIRTSVYKGSRNVIPHASLVNIRLIHKEIQPEFLALHLNSSVVQNYLQKSSVGEVINALRLPDIGQIEVPEISLERQQEAVAMFHNIQNQKNAHQEIIDNLDQIWKTSITNLTQ